MKPSMFFGQVCQLMTDLCFYFKLSADQDIQHPIFESSNALNRVFNDPLFVDLWESEKVFNAVMSCWFEPNDHIKYGFRKKLDLYKQYVKTHIYFNSEKCFSYINLEYTIYAKNKLANWLKYTISEELFTTLYYLIAFENNPSMLPIIQRYWSLEKQLTEMNLREAEIVYQDFSFIYHNLMHDKFSVDLNSYKPAIHLNLKEKTIGGEKIPNNVISYKIDQVVKSICQQRTTGNENISMLPVILETKFD